MDPLIDILPAANVVTDVGAVKVNKSSAYILKQPVLKADLLARGYPHIQVVRGFKMILQYTDPQRLVVDYPAPWLQMQKSVFLPRYEPEATRMPLAEAKEILESVLPGINWTYLYALLAARSANEARIGLPQHIMVTGVTGAAKTAHVFLAAGILGDVANQVQYTSDVEKFRSGLREASAYGSLLLVDEFMKDSLRANTKMTQDKVLDPLLNLSPSSMSHKMYTGPVALGHLGVIIWTETSVPVSLRGQAQIARRVHYVKLVKEVNWDQPLAQAGLSEIQQIRTHSVDFARACNSVLSDFVDRYLPYPRTFDDLAAELGVQKLRDSTEFDDPTEKLVELYKATIAEPQTADALFLKKFPGKGYKRVDKDKGDDRLVDAWTVLANGGGNDWYQSQAAMEKDWSRILGVPDSVHLDVHDDQNGHQLAIRFRVGQKRNPEKVNEEIKPLDAFKG
jgi:hypothetical protein